MSNPTNDRCGVRYRFQVQTEASLRRAAKTGEEGALRRPSSHTTVGSGLKSEPMFQSN